MRVLLTGGVKSGKSSFALEYAREHFPREKYFLATSVPLDDEMSKRIEIHQDERNTLFDGEYTTIEEPVVIDTALRNNMVVDCITMWINNMFYYDKTDLLDEILEGIIKNMPENIIFITNEVGLGNIPPDQLTRQYNMTLAGANKQLAAACDEVYLLTCGIPLQVK